MVVNRVTQSTYRLAKLYDISMRSYRLVRQRSSGMVSASRIARSHIVLALSR